MTIHQFVEFVRSVESKISTNAPYAVRCMDSIRPSLLWTANQMNMSSSSSCNLLLQGCYGSAVEAVSLVSFGLIRPAVLSLRSYYELSLQYMYYKDHPIEWRSVKQFRSQPDMPGVIVKYLRDNLPKFERRIAKLTKVKNRTIDDCYKVLSGVAHGTAIHSISSATEPVELMESEIVISQTVTVFHDVGEHLCDIYVASFESNWLSLPETTRNNLEIRFGDKNPRTELDM